MRKFFLMIAALATLIAPLAITTSADAATTRQYVSRTEFHSIHKNYRMSRVHSIFGDGRKYAGTQTSYYGEIDAEWCDEGETWACATQTRKYRTKSRWGTVYVDYYRAGSGIWRVDTKSAYWG
jgi:hypothetical protein